MEVTAASADAAFAGGVPPVQALASARALSSSSGAPAARAQPQHWRQPNTLCLRRGRREVCLRRARLRRTASAAEAATGWWSGAATAPPGAPSASSARARFQHPAAATARRASGAVAPPPPAAAILPRLRTAAAIRQWCSDRCLPVSSTTADTCAARRRASRTAALFSCRSRRHHRTTTSSRLLKTDVGGGDLSELLDMWRVSSMTPCRDEGIPPRKKTERWRPVAKRR